MPRPMLAVMRLLPVWKRLRGAAHTVPNDLRMVESLSTGRPPEPGRWDSVTQPVLMMAGGKSDAWMQNAAHAIAGALPNRSEERRVGKECRSRWSPYH